MQLQLFRTLWGTTGDIGVIAACAKAAGFDGLEGQVPTSASTREALRAALERHGLAYIAEVTTAGSYVPERHATVDEHLESLAARLAPARELGARFVTCIGGCDAWPLADSLRFFRAAMTLADDAGIAISFETHRSRTLFNPWVTREVAAAIPDIRFTFDFSHWCVVCERLLDTELATIRALAPHAMHIHARVGYDQGPQVPHPFAPEYAEALAAHRRWWEMLWSAMAARGESILTMTPEAGPDGYLHTLPFTQAPVADLWEINRGMAAGERVHFADWLAARTRSPG